MENFGCYAIPVEYHMYLSPSTLQLLHLLTRTPLQAANGSRHATWIPMIEWSKCLTGRDKEIRGPREQLVWRKLRVLVRTDVLQVISLNVGLNASDDAHLAPGKDLEEGVP